MAEMNQSYENVLKERSRNKRSIYGLRRTYPAYIILILFIGLSYFIYDQTKVMVYNNLKQEFKKASNSVITRLEAKKQRKLEVINSVSTLFDVLPFIVPKDYFELYSTVPTLTYPSILGVIYVPRVTDTEKSLFEYNTKSMGYYDYFIHPEGKRDVYYPSEYFVPLEHNSHMLGYDYFTDPTIKKSLEKAIETNSLVTSPFKIYRSNDTLSFFMISPIYKKGTSVNTATERKKNFQSAVFLEIDAELFFENAINSAKVSDGVQGFASDSTIYFKILDYDYDNNSKVVYHSSNSNYFNDKKYKPAISEVIDYQLADRILKINFATVPNFGGDFQALLPLITLIVSLITSFGFFAFLLALITSRARAVDLAEKMTRSQRRIVETSNDMIGIMDFKGNWKSMNPASENILEYSPDNMLETNFSEYLKNKNVMDQVNNIVNNAKEEEHNKIDIEMVSSSGDIKWVSWSLTISITDNVIYALGRDVTLEKLAEQEALLKSKQIQLAERFANEANESKTLFMIKLSHQLRNNLTGITGYLQMLSHKAYDSEEEQDSYVQMALESSEEVFTFVSDLVDNTITSDPNQKVNYELTNIKKMLDLTKDELNEKYNHNLLVEITTNDEISKAKALVDGKLFSNALYLIIDALVKNQEGSKIEIFAQENPYEKMTEVQILGSEDAVTEEMIKIYKENSNNIIDILKKDKEDVLYNLASASSIIRRINGSITFDTFGGKDGNVVMINLPVNQQLE